MFRAWLNLLDGSKIPKMDQKMGQSAAKVKVCCETGPISVRQFFDQF